MSVGDGYVDKLNKKKKAKGKTHNSMLLYLCDH